MDENLGKLQYDMIVSDEKLKESLSKIDSLLVATDDKWKKALSNMGSGGVEGIIKTQNAIIELARASSTTATSNQNLIKSNDAVGVSYAKLEQDIKAETIALKALSQAERELPENKAAIANLQKKIDLYAQFKESLNAEIKLRREDEAATKRQTAEAERLAKQLLRLNEAQKLQRGKLQSTVSNTTAGTVERLDAERAVLTFDKKNLKEDTAETDRLTRSINENKKARKALTESIAQQRRVEAANLTTQKLEASVAAQSAGSIGKLRAELALLVHQLNQVGKTTPKSTAEIQRLTAAMTANKNAQMAMAPTLGMWGKLVSAIKTYATAYLSVQAVMGLGRAVYNQTKELDQLAFGMKTVIKSSVELANTQKFLSEVAVNYGGDLLTLSERYIKFRAAAQQSNMSAAETQKIFDSMSKAAGTLGLKTDELSGVYLALEQMISKGKVTTEELRRQLGERLPGAFGIMANALGVTIPQLDKMLKKGEVLSKDALPKFADAIEKAYGIESLKKIDTLAAAQGRMSTEFTGLIQAMEMSGGFKSFINGMATAIGFVKDYMGVFGLLAKALLLIGVASATYRTIALLSIPVQRALILLGKEQVGWLVKLSAAQLTAARSTATAAAATTMWARAWNALKLAFVSNPIGAIITGLSLIAASIYLIVGRSKQAEKSVADFTDNLAAEKSKLDQLFTSIQKVRKGTYEYKDALFQINNLYGKYLPNLLTEKSSIDEVAKARLKANEALQEEMMLRERNSMLELASADKDKATAEIMNSILASSPSLSAAQKGQVYNRILDIANLGELDPAKRRAIIEKAFTGDLDAIEDYVSKATFALEGYKAKVENINDFFDPNKKGSSKPPKILNLEELKAAEEEFKKLEELQKVGGQLANPNYSEDFATFKDYLLAKRKEFASSLKSDYEAREAIDLKLAELEKDKPSDKSREKIAEQRAEALKKLNDRYLADQEEFANFEAGIAAGRIAEMEDGIEKEKKLNELAYENRIAAIEKEKIARLKLLNDNRDPKSAVITSYNATGYTTETQAAINTAKADDIQFRLNAEQVLREANLKSEKDYQIKINELRRDANDQFLTGLEKERAAINEKYDEWVRKAGDNMKLIAEIEHGRGAALDTIYRQNELDQLDFKREIEYKKNEIVNFGAAKQRKLEKANFDTYVKFEEARIKLLKASKSTLQQGIDAEQMLVQDKKLFKIKQEKELRDKILEGINKATDVLVSQLGLTGQAADELKGAVDALSSVAKGDYLSAAISVFGMVAESFDLFGKDRDAEMQKHIDYINETIEAQLRYNLALHDSIDLQAKQSIFFTDNANEILIATQKYANAQEEYNKILDNFIWPSDGTTRRGDKKDLGERKGANLSELLRNLYIPAEIGYTSLLGKYPELIKANGEFNAELAKTVLALSGLPPATTQALNGLIEWSDKMKEAQKAMDDAVSSMIGNLGSSIYTALSDAWDNGTDSFLAFKDTVSAGLEDIIKQMMFNAIWAASLEEFKQGIIDSYKVGGDQSIFDNIDIFFANAPENIKLTNEALAELDKRAAASGMDWKGDSSTDSANGISKSIQALTEDTGRRLEGLINSIRETGVINMGNVTKLVEQAQIQNNYASESLGVLRNIDKTTASQLTLFNEIMTSASGVGGKGMKVYIQ